MSILSYVAGRIDKGSHAYLPIASPRMRVLFWEFLRRNRDLQMAQRRETIWLSTVIVLGVLAVVLPVPARHGGVILSFGCIGLLFMSVRRYQAANRVVRHLSVNVHILYHHLLGKLEVGFCEHKVPCNCAEEFRRYVWRTYRISLYGTSPTRESPINPPIS